MQKRENNDKFVQCFILSSTPRISPERRDSPAARTPSWGSVRGQGPALGWDLPCWSLREAANKNVYFIVVGPLKGGKRGIRGKQNFFFKENNLHIMKKNTNNWYLCNLGCTHTYHMSNYLNQLVNICKVLTQVLLISQRQNLFLVRVIFKATLRIFQVTTRPEGRESYRS